MAKDVAVPIEFTLQLIPYTSEEIDCEFPSKQVWIYIERYIAERTMLGDDIKGRLGDKICYKITPVLVRFIL